MAATTKTHQVNPRAWEQSAPANVKAGGVFTSQPRDNGNLVEKYRPRCLDDIVGNAGIVYQLKEFCADPCPNAFIFDGSTGVGKTSAAVAFAYDLGVRPDSLMGGFREIAGGENLVERVREMFADLRLRPMLGSGWKVLVVNEADQMSPACEAVWLSALEDIPEKCVIIFTTNNAARMPQRLTDRFERYRFNASALEIGPDVQLRVNEIWQRETGRTDAPKFQDLPGTVNSDGEVSIRACLQGLNPLVRLANKDKPRKAPAIPQVKPMPNPEPKPAETDKTLPEASKPAPIVRKPGWSLEPAPKPRPEVSADVKALHDLLAEHGLYVRDGKLAVLKWAIDKAEATAKEIAAFVEATKPPPVFPDGWGTFPQAKPKPRFR